jgi:hypothetical protein
LEQWTGVIRKRRGRRRTVNLKSGRRRRCWRGGKQGNDHFSDHRMAESNLRWPYQPKGSGMRHADGYTFDDGSVCLLVVNRFLPLCSSQSLLLQNTGMRAATADNNMRKRGGPCIVNPIIPFIAIRLGDCEFVVAHVVLHCMCCHIPPLCRVQSRLLRTPWLAAAALTRSTRSKAGWMQARSTSFPTEIDKEAESSAMRPSRQEGRSDCVREHCGPWFSADRGTGGLGSSPRQV